MDLDIRASLVSINWKIPQINHKVKYICTYMYFLIVYMHTYIQLGFPGGSNGKESACNAGDLALIPGSGRSPGEGNGNTLQYSCLGNPMDREAQWATVVHGVRESDVTNTFTSDFPGGASS